MANEDYMGIKKTLRGLCNCIKCGTVWTIKMLNIKCEYDELQPECKKYCCNHCPKASDNLEEEFK